MIPTEKKHERDETSGLGCGWRIADSGRSSRAGPGALAGQSRRRRGGAARLQDRDHRGPLDWASASPSSLASPSSSPASPSSPPPPPLISGRFLPDRSRIAMAAKTTGAEPAPVLFP